MEQRCKDSKRKEDLTPTGALNQSLGRGLGPDLPIPRVHAQTFIAGYEGLQVLAPSSLTAFLSLLPLGETVPEGLGVGIRGFWRALGG